MFILFVCDTSACYSTYKLLQSGGFEIVRKACQANELKDLMDIPLSQIEEFCHVIQINAKDVALAALVGWKLVGLSEFGTMRVLGPLADACLDMVLLTWTWYKCVVEKEHTRLKEMSEKETGESAGLVKLTGEETLYVEQKV